MCSFGALKKTCDIIQSADVYNSEISYHTREALKLSFCPRLVTNSKIYCFRSHRVVQGPALLALCLGSKWKNHISIDSTHGQSLNCSSPNPSSISLCSALRTQSQGMASTAMALIWNLTPIAHGDLWQDPTTSPALYFMFARGLPSLISFGEEMRCRFQWWDAF